MNVGLVLGVVAPGAAHADTTHECVASANAGQSLRDTGKLTAARDAFARCSVDSCPAVVSESCQRWSREVATRLPTITLGARSDSGEDLARVRVSIDGAIVATRLDGLAIAVDPGPHAVVFHADGFVDAHQALIVREGEKARPVVGALTKPAPVTPSQVPASTGSRRDLTPLIVSGAITVVGAAGFAVFGIWGQREKDHLSDTCAATQTCASTDVSAARTKLVVADISLAVGVVGAGFLTAFSVAPLFEKSSGQSSTKAPSIGVAPTRSGAFGTLEWRY